MLWIFWVKHNQYLYVDWSVRRDNLVKIILQFDIILIQEVLDKTEKSLQSLLEAVNVGVKEAAAGDSQAAPNFRLISSPRLGRAEPREQYAFFYRWSIRIITWLLVIIILIVRAERVSVVDSAVYPDEEKDTFMREPFVLKFSSEVIAGLDNFVIIAIHTQPKVILVTAHHSVIILDCYLL